MVLERCKDLIKKFKIKLSESSLHRKNLVKYLIRREVFDLAAKTVSKFNNLQNSIGNDFSEEVDELRGYFSQFKDLPDRLNNLRFEQPEKQQVSQTLFSGFSRFISSFFSDSNSNDSNNEKPIEKRIVKVLLKGPLASGKTSFLKSSALKRPVDGYIRNSIPLDFATVETNFNNELIISTQLWDQHRYEKPTEFTNIFAVILTINPYNPQTIEDVIEPIKQQLKNSTIEVILLETMKDLNEMKRRSRNLPPLLFEQYSFEHFENFGGLTQNISNTNIEEPTLILWYCTLLSYIMMNT